MPALRALAGSHEVLAAVTQPDRPKGRGHRLSAPPVKEAAEELGIAVLQPERLLREPEAEGDDLKIPEADCYVVAAYGQIFPKWLLDAPEHGCINIHASLLPRHRGAAPIERAVEAGDKVTGISIMRMEEGLDTGDVCLARELEIKDKTAAELEAELSHMGAELVLEALDLIESGRAEFRPQVGESNYARKITKADFRLDAGLGADEIIRKVRAFGFVKTELDGRGLKVFDLVEMSGEAEAKQGGPEGAEGCSARIVGDDVVIDARDGRLKVLELQPDNSKRMSADAFLRGIFGRRG